MIAQIKGKVVHIGKKNSILVDVAGICYEVLIPSIIMRQLEGNFNEDGSIHLITYHYLQTDMARSTPILIGFLNEVEKEFFEEFITVSGIGPRAAVKAFSRPISEIVKAIDEGDTGLLTTLPGIGMQRAREIVAKLQGKVGKFGLIQDKKMKEPQAEKMNWQEEALEVLLQLQYKRKEAQEMIHKALNRKQDISSAEELLNEVYRQRKK
ncbi:MAG: Holliday junction DNA helicase RuvA [Candidatus Omnitrophica bacterium]|nr:Holliday junction DNA helicase RuvA [Candidatus Omnitrophota bacterium]